MIDAKNCWVEVTEEADFTIHNIPFGIFSAEQETKRIGIAIGEQIMDLSAAYTAGIFSAFSAIEGFDESIFINPYLNDFIALGKNVTSSIRLIIQEELCDENSKINHPRFFRPIQEVQLHLPVKIGDYTDFYSSIEHATNVGSLFRDPKNALLPNWKHLPVAYHGRASSIISSGVSIHRPKGQMKSPSMENPVFGPTKRLDFELEMGYIIGRNSELGRSISTAEAEDYIFGKVIFNDWSARDIQQWEYVPLGPFLGKNFASTISPWVVTMEALEPFRTAGPNQQTTVLPYLAYEGAKNFDINLEVSIEPHDGSETIICRSNFKYMYWNMAQQLAHHTSNGCNLNIGDLFASGTISGATKESYGSLLELSEGGKSSLILDNGSTRSFLEDFDTVHMRAHCTNEKIRVGFGSASTQILPALN